MHENHQILTNKGGKTKNLVFKTSGGAGITRNLNFGYMESAEKWVEDKLNLAILHFLPKI